MTAQWQKRGEAHARQLSYTMAPAYWATSKEETNDKKEETNDKTAWKRTTHVFYNCLPLAMAMDTVLALRKDSA